MNSRVDRENRENVFVSGEVSPDPSAKQLKNSTCSTRSPRPLSPDRPISTAKNLSPSTPLHGKKLHVLFPGRVHDPLKGVRYLEQAVKEINNSALQLQLSTSTPIDLHLVSNKYGEELEKEWDWCDVLCLPTLSENFGRVVAEALAHGKQVITTDGAPAWRDWVEMKNEELRMKNEGVFHHSSSFILHPSFTYLTGYREGVDKTRVQLLVDAIKYYLY